ncbi:MAG: lipopolysaccharide heptosyltransferase II, partial [bacterium]
MTAKRILIVAPAWVGDMVMAQSLLMDLKRAAPSAAIHVLAPTASLPVTQRMEEVTESIALPLGHGEFGLRVRYRLGRALRALRFDRAIVLPGSFKSALVPWFANIAQRTGYVGEQRFGLLNDIRALDQRAMPMNVQRFVALGRARSAAVPTAAECPRPALRVDASEAAETAARLGLAGGSSESVIALCPGAEYGQAKRWPAEHFAEVARAQLSRGRRVWLFGAHGDRAIAARINQLCDLRCDDLAGRTTLGEAIDLMSLADCAVTNDSGLMHIAAAVGCRVIALYGSSSDAFTPPLTAPGRSHRLRLGLDCSPCFQRTCPLGHLDCLNKLLPQR